ncbi:uncharacterized protein LOC129818284, partial [Salvelinus fontinalis]|uniref:uncharacterized protein LOC129818284 n=1 Tax=Salvelinus fontinalis TaxID=8038 RepID=UPI0024862D34
NSEDRSSSLSYQQHFLYYVCYSYIRFFCGENLLEFQSNVFSVVVSTGAYRVSVKTGGSTTIPCHYVQKYKTNVKYLCKVDYLKRCSPDVHTKSINKASISHDINQQTFTVTMTDLEPEDSGRYWCAVETNGGPDVRTEWIDLSVTAGKIPATLPYDYMTGVLVSFTDVTIIVQVDMRNVGICLLSILYTLYHHYDICYKKTLHHSGPSFYFTRQVIQDPFPVNGDDVTYSTVVTKRRNQLNVQTKAEPDDNVVYSPLSQQLDPFSANRDDVTYSTVVPKRRNQLNNSEDRSSTLQQTIDVTRRNVLMVTMSGLKMENTGWYRCEVGDLKMPVHITVRRQPTTQSTTTMTTTQAPTN